MSDKTYNILTAIQAIVNNHKELDKKSSQGDVHNRMNQRGEALEFYVKNAFADCLETDIASQNEARSKAFSYLGNNTNPPDAMLKGGDAIEIKKVETNPRQLQLNSSYPKSKLRADNPKICKTCIKCEGKEWTERDMIYVIGKVTDAKIHSLFFVYGDLYCDAKEIYENVESLIKKGLRSIEGLTIEDTNELGRVKHVDHLEISDLRIRGMWIIQSPNQVFQYLIKEDTNYTFKLIALIPEYKYNAFSNTQEFENFCSENGVHLDNKSVPDPQNPAELITVKLIQYYC